MEFGKTAMDANVIDKIFWKNKRVLVTGHTGFKGSWLTCWLKNLGSSVVGYSLPPPTKPSLFESARVEEGMTSILGDVRNLDEVQAAIFKYKPEIVFHLAAQPLVRYSYLNPVETYATNIMGTVNILESIRQSDTVRLAVIVTSDKCYENKEWVWGYRESDSMGGKDPYSSSKGCAELVAAAYQNSYFTKKIDESQNKSIATARAGNVIGGGDWAADRIIPDIMKAFLESRTVLIRNPNAVRPWQHVLEPLRGYLMLAEGLWNQGEEYLGGWNFGPGNEDARPVSWIVELVSQLWGKNAGWELMDTKDHLHEALYLRLDCSKANSVLGWLSKLHLSEALEWTVEWYKSYGQGRNMMQLTENQIARYEALE
jgi:CDP-glucose 4,6-dehydratase